MKQSGKKVQCTLFYLVIFLLVSFISCAYMDLEGLDTFEKEITAFVFRNEENRDTLPFDVAGKINSDTINITVPARTNLDLVPTITFKGKAISPESGQPQTFVNGVGISYIVYADDNTEKKYTITVKTATEKTADITAFAFLMLNNPALLSDIVGTISGNNINITVPPGTDTGSLVPAISITGVAVNPGNNVSQSFPDSIGITYTVTADDNSTNDYTVTVFKAPLPGNSGALGFSGITSSAITATWSIGTDGLTPKDKLEYLLYYSTSNNIDTVANMEANGTAVGAYTAYLVDLVDLVVTGLNSGTTYYFNVIIKDQHGSKTAYVMNPSATLEGIPPVTGNNGLLVFSGATASTIDISWEKAADNDSGREDLQYLVYYSNNNDIDTVTGMEANGTPFGSYAFDIDEIRVTGLSDSITYYFNIIVKDKNNNKAAYSPNSYFMSDAIPPVQAVITGVAESNMQVSIDWTDPGDVDFDHIELSWTPAGTGINSIGTGTQTFTASGLTNGIEYTFSIVSVDTADNKSSAVIVKATPTADGPFISCCIYTADDFDAIRGNKITGWDKTQSYIMMADVDLSGYSPWTPIGTPGDEFSGNLNGNGHIITGLYIDTTSDYQGLFGYISGKTIIKNLWITDCDINAGKYIGALAGQFDQDGSGKAMIQNVHISGTVVSNYNANGVLCLGGIVGWLGTTSGTDSMLLECSSNVTVTTTGGGTLFLYIGGITGKQEDAWKISKCYVKGSVGSSRGIYIGGIIGISSGNIYNCYSEADVTGYQFTGGLGGGTTGSVYNSYAAGNVSRSGGTNTTFGGLIDNASPANVDSSYYSGILSDGLEDNENGTRKEPYEMQDLSTFDGWDFDTTWGIHPDINDGFPYLRSNMPE